MSGDSAALIAARALSLGFATTAPPVLESVDLALHRGEVVALVGESGSGKTLLALALTGLLPPGAALRGGEVLRHGRAAMVFQNPRAMLSPVLTVGRHLRDVLARHDPAGGGRAAVLAALEAVRIARPATLARAYPQDLSGGEAQRVGIALALAARPDVLIADEPVTGLDGPTAAAVMGLVRGLVVTRGLGVLLITHDLALAADHADRVVVIHAGQIAEAGPVQAVLGQPAHPYAAALVAANPALATRLADLAPLPGTVPDLMAPGLPPCRFAPRCPRHGPGCDRAPPRLRSVGGGRGVACVNPL